MMPFSALFPLLLAGACSWPPLRRHILHLLPLAVLPALLLLFLLPDGARIVLPHTLMQASWTMDATGRLFHSFTAAAWLFASLFAIPYLRDDTRQGGFAVPFLIAMSGNFLLTTASDAMSFYSGFAIMGFASWGLVVFNGTPEARKAGRVYLALVVLGELMVFPGLVKGVLWAGTAEMADIRTHWALDPNPGLQISLIFFGFALKLGLVPLHFWLPLAHPAAPAPASAVLSGCMIKAGLLGMLRLIPFGEFPMPVLGALVAFLGAAGMIGAQLLALAQTGAKALLAYSSVSKMGAVLLLLSPGMLNPDLHPLSLAAALSYAAFHALHKTALFLGTAVTPKHGKALLFPLLLLAASFAALPGSTGDWIKVPQKALLYALPESHRGLYAGFLSLSFLLGILVMARFVLLTRPAGKVRAPLIPSGAVWMLSVLAALLFPLLLDTPGVPAYSQSIELLTGLKSVPLWAALLLLLPACLFKWRVKHPIPPGDLLAIMPPLPARWITGLQSSLKNCEIQLRGAPGGLLYLLLVLLFLVVLWPGN